MSEAIVAHRDAATMTDRDIVDELAQWLAEADERLAHIDRLDNGPAVLGVEAYLASRVTGQWMAYTWTPRLRALESEQKRRSRLALDVSTTDAEKRAVEAVDACERPPGRAWDEIDLADAERWLRTVRAVREALR